MNMFYCVHCDINFCKWFPKLYLNLIWDATFQITYVKFVQATLSHKLMWINITVQKQFILSFTFASYKIKNFAKHTFLMWKGKQNHGIYWVYSQIFSFDQKNTIPAITFVPFYTVVEKQLTNSSVESTEMKWSQESEWHLDCNERTICFANKHK